MAVKPALGGRKRQLTVPTGDPIAANKHADGTAETIPPATSRPAAAVLPTLPAPLTVDAASLTHSPPEHTSPAVAKAAAGAVLEHSSAPSQVIHDSGSKCTLTTSTNDTDVAPRPPAAPAGGHEISPAHLDAAPKLKTQAVPHSRSKATPTAAASGAGVGGAAGSAVAQTLKLPSSRSSYVIFAAENRAKVKGAMMQVALPTLIPPPQQTCAPDLLARTLNSCTNIVCKHTGARSFCERQDDCSPHCHNKQRSLR